MRKFWYEFWYVVIVLFVIGCMLVSGVLVLAGLVNLFTCGVNWPLWILAIIGMFASARALGDLLGD